MWTVLEIDHKRKLIYVEHVEGKVPAYFGECPGDINTRILERMRQVLKENDIYPYLMKNAAARLEASRRTAAVSGVADKPLVCLGGDMWCLFPWLGTYSFIALERFIKIRCAEKLGIRGVESWRPYFIQFKMKAGEEEFFRVLKEEAAKELDAMELVYPKEVPVFEKYDDFVPDELVRKGFAYGVLNTDEMLYRILNW